MTQHTTVILDWSVMAHALQNVYVQSGLDKDKQHWDGVLKAQLSWMQSCQWLGELLTDPDKTQTISVCDSKPYWRTEYLTRPEVYGKIPKKVDKRKKNPEPTFQTEPIAYKGGRKFPDYHFTKLKDKGSAIYAQQGWAKLTMTNYEADDLAAAIVMMNRMLPLDRQHRIILATVDADWMGLIDHNTTWFCSTGYLPRVRYTMDDVNVWARKRLGRELNSPREIWDVKTVLGDKSDNLPPGSPIEVIDLCQPPMEHRLWLKPGVRGVIQNVLTNPRDLYVKDPSAAVDYLRRLGVSKVISTYDPTNKRQPFQEAA